MSSYYSVYVGVTSNLLRRTWEHKNSLIEGFTQKYNVKNLVYYEVLEGAEEAIKREKRLKKWKRDWKIRLVEMKNPNWDDLYNSL